MRPAGAPAPAVLGGDAWNRFVAVLCLALVDLHGLDAAAAAAGPRGPGQVEYTWAVSLHGKLSNYAFNTSDLGDMKLKIGKQCFMQPDRRGLRLTSTVDGGGGSFRYGFPVGDHFQASGAIDVSKLRTPGAFAGFEFRSPDANGMPFVLVGAIRNMDGSIGVFANDSGTNVGTPQVFGADQDCLLIGLTYDSGLISVDYTYNGPALSILEDYAFAYDTSGGIGAGMFAAGKGDAVTLTLDVTGDLYDSTKQGILFDLKAALDLETGAQMDLQNSNGAAATTKLMQAQAIIAQGTQIPLSDPPEFTGPLIQRAKALSTDAAFGKAGREAAEQGGRQGRRRDREDRRQQAARRREEGEAGGRRQAAHEGDHRDGGRAGEGALTPAPPRGRSARDPLAAEPQ